MRKRSETCEHKSFEDCLICSICGNCSESLDSQDICADCGGKNENDKIVPSGESLDGPG